MKEVHNLPNHGIKDEIEVSLLMLSMTLLSRPPRFIENRGKLQVECEVRERGGEEEDNMLIHQ